MLDALFLAHVVGDRASLSQVIADGHPLPAEPTQHQSLEQRRPFSRWPLAPVAATGLGVFPQRLLVALVPVPGDVSDMSLRQQRVPLVGRQALAALAALVAPRPAGPAM